MNPPSSGRDEDCADSCEASICKHETHEPESERECVKNDVNNVRLKDIYPQVIASMVAFSFTIQSGINMVYSNLLQNNMHKEQASWIASVGIITTPLGAIISGPLNNRIGRRNIHIVIGIPCVISWIIFSVANITDFSLLITATILAGISSGLCTASLVYVAEITHKNYRGMMLSLLSIYVSLGILITTVIGAFFNWKQMANMFAVIFFILIVTAILYIPESPYWLLNFGSQNETRAMKNFERLNPNTEVRQTEWASIRRTPTMESYQRMQWKLSDASIYRPLITLMFLMFLQQISGVYPALSYAKRILSDISRKPMDENNTTFLLLGTARFLMAVFTTVVSKYFARKTILITSTISMAVLCFTLYGTLSLPVIITMNDDYQRLQNTCATILFLCYLGISSFGIMTIPWTLIPELLPTSFKSVGTSFLISYTYLLYFCFTKTLPFLLDFITLKFFFLSSATFSVLLTIFTRLYIPETFGKNPREIADYFNDKPDRRHHIGNDEFAVSLKTNEASCA